MTSLLSSKETKKNVISQISNSNKNIFIKKVVNKKKEEIINHNDLHDKILRRKNALLTNTSVKKIKQIKKISINDNENKCVINKSKKKLDSSNKENHGINNKEKNDIKKSTKKKILKNIVNATKIEIKEKFPQKIIKNTKNKEIIKNKDKLSIFLNNTENIPKINTYQKKEEEKNKSFIKNKNKGVQQKEKEIQKNNSLLISQNKSTIINEENGKDLKDELNLNEIEYSKKYERKNMSEQKIRIQDSENIGNIIPLIKMKKEHIKYSIKKKKQKANINIKNKKLVYEEDINNSELKKYNSINNEIETNKSYIDIINNFDIINIINKKEETKKLSSSIQKNSLNHTQELSQKRILKQNNSISNNHINKKILNILKTKQNNKTTNKNNKNNKIQEKSSGPMTMRNKNPKNNNLYLLNSEKKNTSSNSFINNNGIQNKWDKKYFIPIVSASLVGGGGEDKIIEKNQIYKKINTEKGLLDIYNYNNNNIKKSINFGDNNKKKREMLFNFSNKKLKNENYSYINFQSKRTNSFISKRNQHITERNNSINNMKKDNYNSNIDNDLDQQEKKLELIRSEISQEKIKDKLNKTNKCAISVDNICDNSFDKNKMEEIVESQGNKKKHKKFKTFHIKVNSLNMLKKSKNKSTRDNNKSNDIMIIKRGDLLNRLRNIKHNYSVMENVN